VTDVDCLHINKLLGFIPAVAIMVLIYYFSAQSNVPAVAVDAQLAAVAGHLVAYGALTVALFLVFEHAGWESRRAALWGFAGASLYGATDEIHQFFVPGRHADPIDLLTNAMGAAFFLWVFLSVRTYLPESIGRRVLSQTRRRS